MIDRTVNIVHMYRLNGSNGALQYHHRGQKVEFLFF